MMGMCNKNAYPPTPDVRNLATAPAIVRGIYPIQVVFITLYVVRIECTEREEEGFGARRDPRVVHGLT